MTRSTFTRALVMAACLAALGVAALPAAAGTGPKGQAAAKKSARQRASVSQLYVFGGTEVVPLSGAQLVRTNEGVFMTLHTSGLEPGTIATVWWAFFNEPRNCAGPTCTPADLPNPDVQAALLVAAGRVVGADGTLDVGAFRAVGDTSGAQLGPGLLNPFKAEIHLVVRTHGPALVDDAAAFRDQLTTFNGGCPPNTCTNLQAAVFEP